MNREERRFDEVSEIIAKLLKITVYSSKALIIMTRTGKNILSDNEYIIYDSPASNVREVLEELSESIEWFDVSKITDENISKEMLRYMNKKEQTDLSDKIVSFDKVSGEARKAIKKRRVLINNNKKNDKIVQFLLPTEEM